ncbi:hypothetical protein D1006_22655 [Burkholderia stabilis]|uniref:Uncharacterized protein n=2 Tax=Burkholderia stabilis TaxID=95485 RepID=A0A4Q2AH18_9BURK|nr:hypothetical protein D1006_22655 [Burkholderia stabilis]
MHKISEPMAENERAGCPYFIHSSISLYAMVQQLHTTQTCSRDAIDPMYSGNMQMICTSDPFICTYLSPLDAVMGSRTLVGDDDHFWPIDFRQVDTRRFMEQHGRLLVAVNYAYGATGDRLIVSDAGHPVMIYTFASFDVPIEHRAHFTIRFPDSVVERIETAYLRAGLSGFSKTLDMMDAWTADQIADAEGEALASIPPTIAVEDAAIDQYAIYDPESSDWIFTHFD